MSQSNFTTEGLPLGKGDKNLTYLYGLSDFWTVIFEDSDKINLLLEATSQKMADIYSEFLQLSSTISLTDIQVYSNQQLKLVLLGESAAVNGLTNTFTLPTEIISTKHIANRPLLPTAYLEQGIHYYISADGTQITFNSSIGSLGFPARILSTGERQYAMWFIDAEIDEQFIYKHFGKLIGTPEPDKSTETYKNFVYGLYYLYVNGPDISSLIKGLNISLGIPLARDNETVLETRKYLNTDQYLVITDTNSYLIPYGLAPSVSVGDVLEPADQLAAWVEVKDYRSDGDWWINLQIPSNVMPYIPPGEPDRYAKAGSYADYLMRNYLKKHTFLVNVKTIDFKNLQTFEQLSQIINDVKPRYTTPIYIWTVPTPDEILELDDGGLGQARSQFRCENLSLPIEKMNRKLATYAKVGSYGPNLNLTGNEFTVDAGWTSVKADIGMSSGKYYWEVSFAPRYPPSSFNLYTYGLPLFAFMSGVGQITTSVSNFVGADSVSVGFYSLKLNYANSSPSSPFYFSPPVSQIYTNNASYSNYAVPVQITDVLSWLFDADTRELTAYINGVSYGVMYTLPPGTYYPMVSTYDINLRCILNFGQQEFKYFPTGVPDLKRGVYSLRSNEMLTRGCPQFIRSNVSWQTYGQLGLDPAMNGDPRSFQSGTITGYIGSNNQFQGGRALGLNESIRAVMNRNSECFRKSRSTMAFVRGAPVYASPIRASTPSTPILRRVPLFITSQKDIVNKFSLVGQSAPGLDVWSFTLFKTVTTVGELIDGQAINTSRVKSYYTDLVSNYSSLFFRGADSYLGAFIPLTGYVTYAPLVSEIVPDDYLLFIRIYENTVACYWVTSNMTANAPFVFPVKSTDPLSISSGNIPLRKSAGMYSPYYNIRGGANNSAANSLAINALVIDGSIDSGSKISVYYSDVSNPTPIPINRAGLVLKINKELA